MYQSTPGERLHHDLVRAHLALQAARFESERGAGLEGWTDDLFMAEREIQRLRQDAAGYLGRPRKMAIASQLGLV